MVGLLGQLGVVWCGLRWDGWDGHASHAAYGLAGRGYREHGVYGKAWFFLGKKPYFYQNY
jgi:hypothetical protein